MQFLITIMLFILEVLFYSLFIKFSKKEGKIWRYILLFTLVSILIGFINSKKLISYFVFVLCTYLGLKYIVRIKASLYDMLVIVVMLLLNVTIEFPIYLIFYKLFHLNLIIVTIMFELVKLFVVVIGKRCFNENYLEFKNVWDRNDFNVRYGFTIIIYLYVIITITLKIITFLKR